MRRLFTVACLVAFSCALSQPQLHHQWNHFKVEHGKSYSDAEEESMRLGLYLKNKKMIDEHNKKYEEGLVTFKMKMNHFGDLTEEEFASMMLSSNQTLPDLDEYPLHQGADTPGGEGYVNWHERGAVTPVRNQGSCGSCWAFSVAGALESHQKIHGGALVQLSVQNILDCSSNRKYNNYGCLGGWMAPGFQYVIDNGGVDTELSYPYTGYVGTCKFKPSTIGAKCKGFVKVPKGNENALRDAIERMGPVSVAFDALRPTFRFYAGGIYYDPSCGSSVNPLNHAVLAIGYGDQFFNSYWILKNSWGTDWGEKGFFRLVRNRMNHCGIASAAVYPLV